MNEGCSECCCWALGCSLPIPSPAPLNGNAIATRADLLSRFACGPDFQQVGDAGDLCPELSTSLKCFFWFCFVFFPLSFWTGTSSSSIILRLAVTSINSGCDCRTWTFPALWPHASSQALPNCCKQVYYLLPWSFRYQLGWGFYV